MPLNTRFRKSEEEFDTRVPSLEMTRSIVRERSEEQRASLNKHGTHAP
jgi:hypothetical protein